MGPDGAGRGTGRTQGAEEQQRILLLKTERKHNMDPKSDKDLLELALKQAEAATTHEKDNREKAAEDLEFVFAEDQWADSVKAERGTRPCLNANDLPVFLDRVVAAQRSNRVGIKVLPVDSNTDPLKADIVGGIIRNIEHESYAHVAYDKAIEAAAAGGYMGAIRIVTEYENNDLFDNDGNIRAEYMDPESIMNAFNQQIRIIPIDNPLNVLFDASARLWHRNDGRYLFLYDDIDVDSFKEQYPKAQTIDFDSGDIPTQMSGWASAADKTVRVAEWFYKESRGSKVIYLILNDKGDFELTTKPHDNPDRVLKEREVEDFRIVWRKMSGKEILEGPIEIPGRLWPIVPVWAKEVNINGKRYLRGMFRYSQDPQRMYIYTQSAITEMLALQPKAPYIGTAQMFEGYEDKWRTANTDNWPYLPINPDDKMPGVMPRREQPPPIPVGLIEQGHQRQIEKKDIIGIHEASLGKKSNETSGLAQRERKESDSSSTYAYHDNLGMAIGQVGRVIIGMIPTVYDTARMLKIMDVDRKTQKLQPVNQPFENEKGETQDPIDLTIGKHDIVTQVGPAYATQRQETLDRLQAIMQYAPAVAALIADELVNLMEIPSGDRLVRRLKTLLPPEIRAEEEGEQGITPDQVAVIVQQAIEQYKQSVEAQQEDLKTQQQVEKTEQERLQTEQERIKLIASVQNVENIMRGMSKSGQA